jgi:DNA-binding MarR family transcriptional regulator
MPAKTSRAQNLGKYRTKSTKRASQSRSSGNVEKVLSLIRTRPGIRPSELNRLLNVQQSDGLRNTLIKRGLIRKKKDGNAMRYYLV